MTNLWSFLWRYELCGLAFTVLCAAVNIVFANRTYSDEKVKEFYNTDNFELNPKWPKAVTMWLLFWPVVTIYRMFDLTHEFENWIHS